MEDGQLAQAEPSCGEKIVLSINSGTDQEKCVWLKVVEAEGLMILVNDNVVRKWRVSRRKMLGSICLSAWKSTKYFFPARREFSVRPARTEREGKLLPVGANLRADVIHRSGVLNSRFARYERLLKQRGPACQPVTRTELCVEPFHFLLFVVEKILF